MAASFENEVDTDKDGRRLVWAAVTVLGLIVLGYAGWLGVAVTGLQQQVAQPAVQTAGNAPSLTDANLLAGFALFYEAHYPV